MLRAVLELMRYAITSPELALTDGPQDARRNSIAASSGKMIAHIVALAATRLPIAVRLKESQTFCESAKVPISISTSPTHSDPNQKGRPPPPLRVAQVSAIPAGKDGDDT